MSRVAAFAVCGAFFALSLVLDMPWYVSAFWAGCALCFFIPDIRRAPADDIEVSDHGVKRRYGRRLEREESVTWDELVKVEIVTNDAGPYAEDFFFVLHGADKGVAVSNELAVKHGLVAELQKRLAGIDNKAIIDASLCIEPRRFLVWEKTHAPEEAKPAVPA